MQELSVELFQLSVMNMKHCLKSNCCSYCQCWYLVLKAQKLNSVFQ